MISQIEISTHCQFNCFYCAGREMPQKHMDMDMFESILNVIPRDITSAILQGEGEPFLNKNIWAMCRKLGQINITPYTITNGGFSFTTAFLHKIKKYFPRIGISIDTINPVFSEKIGRFKLHKILDSLNKLLAVYQPDEIDIYTVILSKDNVNEVKRYITKYGNINHIVQGLQIKDDYVKKYPFNIRNLAYNYRCRYIENDLMRFYNINGIEMPCCFIKDTSSYKSINHTRTLLNNKQLPLSCSGCREIITSFQSN